MLERALLAAVAICTLPGAGLELILHRRAPGALIRTTRAFLYGLAFWPIAIFTTRLPFVSLRGLAFAGLAFGAAAIAYAVRRARREAPLATTDGRAVMYDRAAAAAFVALALAHLLPARSWLVAPGADMSMHTFMTRLIVEAGRLPTSYAPLYPIADFGSYAAGLPATSAIVSVLSGAPARTSSLVVGLLAYPALVAGLVQVARRFASPLAALGAAWLVVATAEMHAYLMWGGNPTVLSFALTFGAIASLVAVRHDDDARRSFPILATGAGLVHVIPILGMAYALPVSGLWWLLRREPAERRAILRAWAPLFALAGALLALPYLLGAKPVVSKHEIAWIARWQRTTWHAYEGRWQNFPITIGPYLMKHLDWGVALLGAATLDQARRRNRDAAVFAPFIVVVLLLVLNSRYWVLPGSPALYPERMLVLLLVPGATFVAASIDGVGRALGALPRAAGGAIALVLTVALGGWAYVRASLAVTRAGERITVTARDLEAIEWLDAHVPKDAIVANNYGDAGAWIPALAFRAVSHPHTNPFYFDEIDAWRQRTAPTYLFIGELARYDVKYRRDVVTKANAEYRLLEQAGGAMVFAIAHPTPAPPDEKWMGR